MKDNKEIEKKEVKPVQDSMTHQQLVEHITREHSKTQQIVRQGNGSILKS